jgi:hypothetical protein
MIIGIHQANFIPWYPFFEKIRKCDRFIIQKHCQYTNQEYMNRFNVGKKWYTMPVVNSKKIENIVDKKYFKPDKSFLKIKRSCKRLDFDLSIFDDCIEESLSATNIKIIKKI